MTKQAQLADQFISKHTIPACEGKVTLARSSGTFSTFIDPRLNDWNLNCCGIATGELDVLLLGKLRGCDLEQILYEMFPNRSRVDNCLSQHQIQKFCEEFPDVVRETDATTLFLSKAQNQEIVVVRVGLQNNGLYVDVHQFGFQRIWSWAKNVRIVVPQRNV